MRYLIACASVALALGMTACGSSDNASTDTGDDAAAPAATTTATPAPTPDAEVVVESPDDYSDVHSKRVRVRGTVEPADATVTVDGVEAKVKRGEWSRTVSGLDRGENTIDVEATAAGYKDDSETLTIVRKRSDAEIAAARQAKREKAERAEASFRANAKSLDYDAVLKNPDRFDGTKAVFSGQVLQAREDGEDGGFMLLQTSCDEYGFCDDLVYVAYDRTISASADDHVTVYGTITGGYEYDTQAGGTNFVPAMDLKYIDE